MGALILATPKSYTPGDYTTTFPLTENPISEGGIWTNGLTDGLDWTDCKTAGGNVVGCQIKNAHYNDSTAILTGVWGADQRVRCIAYISDPRPLTGNPEIEIRLRSVLSAHVHTGYEVLYSVNAAYNLQIVRWDALDDYHVLDGDHACPAIQNGDICEAQISGTTITAWHNGNLIASVSDATYATGNPGIGFWNTNGSQTENDKHGFSWFHAWNL